MDRLKKLIERLESDVINEDELEEKSNPIPVEYLKLSYKDEYYKDSYSHSEWVNLWIK